MSKEITLTEVSCMATRIVAELDPYEGFTYSFVGFNPCQSSLLCRGRVCASGHGLTLDHAFYLDGGDFLAWQIDIDSYAKRLRDLLIEPLDSLREKISQWMGQEAA